jgi:hypothetical protein
MGKKNSESKNIKIGKVKSKVSSCTVDFLYDSTITKQHPNHDGLGAVLFSTIFV